MKRYGRDRSRVLGIFKFKWLCYMAVAFMLAGCFGLGGGSTRVDNATYSSLSVVDSSLVSPVSLKKISVRIDDVNIPVFLDRRELVVEDSFGQGQRMKILEEHNWIEALGPMFARTLRGDLEAYLPNALISSADMYVDNADYRVSVFVDRFVGSLGGRVSVDAKVVIRNSDGKIIVQDGFKYFVDSGEKYLGYVSALDKCVAKLAEFVAEKLK